MKDLLTEIDSLAARFLPQNKAAEGGPGSGRHAGVSGHPGYTTTKETPKSEGAIRTGAKAADGSMKTTPSYTTHVHFNGEKIGSVSNSQGGKQVNSVAGSRVAGGYRPVEVHAATTDEGKHAQAPYSHGMAYDKANVGKGTITSYEKSQKAGVERIIKNHQDKLEYDSKQ